MKRFACGTALAWLLLGALGKADEVDPLVVKQKETAEQNWKTTLGDEAFEHVETGLFLVYGQKAFEKKLRDWAKTFEAAAAAATKAVQLDEKERAWKGKLAIYLFEVKSDFNSFIRKVEKRRPDMDRSTRVVKGDTPYIAVSASAEKTDLGAEQETIELLAVTILAKKMGEKGSPDWLRGGFATATRWAAHPNDPAVKAERKRAFAVGLPKKSPPRSVKEVWSGEATGEELVLLRASVAEFLAYGPYRRDFKRFVEGFRPEMDGQAIRPVEEALRAIGQTPDDFDLAWRAWAIKEAAKK
jgi:hypothetical protein